MMIIFIIAIAVTTLLIIATCLFVADIRSIQTEKQYRLHPYARRWRRRPTISLVGTDSGAQLKDMRRHYKHMYDDCDGELQLLHTNGILDPSKILPAVRRLDTAPIDSVVLYPHMTKPQTLRDFMRTYIYILSSPLAETRAEIGARPTGYHTVLVRSNAARRPIAILYELIAFIGSLAAIWGAAWSVFLAVTTPNTSLLLIVIALLAGWTLWSIGRYPCLSFAHKVWYAALLPAALGYIIYRSISMPFRSLFRLSSNRVRTNFASRSI